MSLIGRVLFSKTTGGKHETGALPMGHTNDPWIIQDLWRVQKTLLGVEIWTWLPFTLKDPPTEEQIKDWKYNYGGLAYCKVRTKEEIEADKKERIKYGEEPRNYDDIHMEVWASGDLYTAFQASLAKARAIEAAGENASEKAKRDGMEKAEELED